MRTASRLITPSVVGRRAVKPSVPIHRLVDVRFSRPDRPAVHLRHRQRRPKWKPITPTEDTVAVTELKPKWTLHLGAVRIGLGLPQEFFHLCRRQRPTGQWHSTLVPARGPPPLWVSPWFQFRAMIVIIRADNTVFCPLISLIFFNIVASPRCRCMRLALSFVGACVGSPKVNDIRVPFYAPGRRRSASHSPLCSVRSPSIASLHFPNSDGPEDNHWPDQRSFPARVLGGCP